MTNQETTIRRVVFVSTMSGVPWGGSEELWSQTALRCCQLGHVVRASVLRWPRRPERLAELAAAGVDVAYRPANRALAGRLLQKCLREFFPGPLDLSERAWLKKGSPDLVVISQGGPWDGVPWMLACLELGLPYCTVIQANSESWWPLDEHLEDNRKAFRAARQIFCISRANRAQLEAQCGMRFDHAEVVANPWQLGRGEPAPWPGDEGGTQIACVARLDPSAKGQDILLEVLSQSKWRERPLRLNLYGAGPCEQLLKSLAALLGLGTVRFHGQVSDVRGIWAANHALVLPSRFEGLPLAIVEAMLCARPVITTAVAGNAELVRDGVNGFVAPAPTAALLDDAMERAWSRRPNWREMGLRARADVVKAVPADPVGEFTQKVLALAGALSVTTP